MVAVVSFGRDLDHARDRVRVLGVAAARRSGRASGSPPAARCGSGRCCRGRVRGGRGTRRSAARRGRRSPAAMAACRSARERSAAAAAACRGRRRSCAGWRRFWVISRSVKNASSVGASSVMTVAPNRPSSRSATSVEQLGHGLADTSRCLGVDVAEERASSSGSSRSTSSPARCQSSSVRTAKAWRRSCGRGRARCPRTVEAGLADQLAERLVERRVGKPPPARGEKERRASRAAGRAGRAARA